MKLFTIGFTKTSAESFFTRLADAGVARLIDVRLNNSSQLAAFAKRDDLRYFLEAICSIGYEHRPELAPTAEMLSAYRNGEIDWAGYQGQFLELMSARQIERLVEPATLQGACLLCSEQTAEQCHRRLVAEYFSERWPELEVFHL